MLSGDQPFSASFRPLPAENFATFFAGHRQVAAVFCNGGAAHRLFTKRVRPTRPEPARALPVVQLPSTSPAHASRTLAAKRDHWRRELLPWLPQA